MSNLSSQVREAILIERKQRQRAEELTKSVLGDPTDGTIKNRSGGRTDRRTKASTIRLPTLKLKGVGDHMLKSQSYNKISDMIASSGVEKVQIRDLSWTDKELVLRVLFAKLNMSDQSTRNKSAKLHNRGIEFEDNGGHPFFVSQNVGDYSPKLVFDDKQNIEIMDDLK